LVSLFFILTVVSKHSNASARRAAIELQKINVPHRTIMKQLLMSNATQTRISKANPSHLAPIYVKKYKYKYKYVYFRHSIRTLIETIHITDIYVTFIIAYRGKSALPSGHLLVSRNIVIRKQISINCQFRLQH
jgi:hypothetical protein